MFSFSDMNANKGKFIDYCSEYVLR